MLLKKVETSYKIESLFDSSNIKAASYNKANNELTLTFGKGNQYLYANVTPTDYTRFELSESQGKSFNDLIKTKYEFVKLGTVDLTELAEQINSLLINEIEEIETEFINHIREMCENHDKLKRIPIHDVNLIKRLSEKLIVANSNYNKSVN